MWPRLSALLTLCLERSTDELRHTGRGGRDYPASHALYPACGYAAVIMDTRAQGGDWSAGATADPGAGQSGPEHPGVMSRGISSPETYYYRRLYLDAVRANATVGEISHVLRQVFGEYTPPLSI